MVLGLVAGTAAFRAAPGAALETAGSQSATSIVVGAGPAQGTVSRAVLGHDYLWPIGTYQEQIMAAPAEAQAQRNWRPRSASTPSGRFRWR